jgi:ABC-type nitrate/sulfonate/bicarbonate transport system ATPase subunit
MVSNEPLIEGPVLNRIERPAPHVVIQDVGMVYEAADRSLVALAAINLSLARGEFVSIIGPSGCGKSTLLRIVGGLQAPSSGRVAIDSAPPREAQRRKDRFRLKTPPLCLAQRHR